MKKNRIPVRQNGSAKAEAHQGKIRHPKYPPAEFKIVRLRECPIESPQSVGPAELVSFWRKHIATSPWFRPERECLVVFLLDVRRRVTGFESLSQGTLDTLLVRIPEVFRLAAMHNASAIVVAHNHPSGDASPSEGDIKVTRDLIQAGRILGMELLDHVIVGDARSKRGDCSLRALGYFPEDCECERPKTGTGSQEKINGKRAGRTGPFTQREAAILRKARDNFGQVPPGELEGIARDLERQARDYRSAAKIIRRTRTGGSWAAIVAPNSVRLAA